MLQSLARLHRFTLHAQDGKLGSVEDLYFDDARWAVRYIVLDTGGWLRGRHVLISPASITAVDWDKRTIAVALTCDQVRNSPGPAAHQPVSRQHEAELIAYYGWPQYWTMSPFGFEPIGIPPYPPSEPLRPRGAGEADPHLRSAGEVEEYRVEGRNGPVGHVADFIFDDESWHIVFMTINAGSRLHKGLVLIKLAWIDSISWEERHVTVYMTRKDIRSSPEFVPRFPVSPEYLDRLLAHYARVS